MKNIKFMIAALCVVLFAACQDKGEWDAPSDSAAPQYGNNNIAETNVLSIKDLMAKYAAEIKNDRIIEITEDIQIKGRVAANDVGGNFYKKITIQDEPANAADMRAMTISIDESGLWGYLPIGQQIVVSLKGLCIGGYGEQAQIGTPYTNNKGVISVGRMSKHVWQQHFKIVGDVKELAPEEFTSSFMNEKDNFSVGGKNYNLVKNAGKLVVFKNVTFKNADGKATLKSGTEAPLTGYFIQEVDQFPGVQFFTSGDYAKFSSTILPFDEETGKAIPCTIIGVAGYYNGTWQISIRRTSDITVGEKKDDPTPGPTPTSSYTMDFKTTGGQGDWTIDEKNKDAALTNDVWTFDAKYGMKATAFANNTNYSSEAWLISPKIDLSGLTTATLTIHQAINYFTSVDVAKTQAVVAVSTDGTNWTDLTLTGWPEKLSWTFFDSTADFSAYAGKKDVQVALKYLSTAAKAGTWEVEKITIE